MNFTPVANTALNRAIFALNYYISTGDHIGEGVATQDEKNAKHTVLGILQNLHDPTDCDDWEKLRARLTELEREKLIIGVRDYGVAGKFHQWGIIVETALLDDFARAVRAKPGPKGWGSIYKFLEQHNLLDEMHP